jgi:predicted nucleic acid-binding Zn ribbon protein
MDKCVICGKEIKDGKPWQKTCSRECSKKYIKDYQINYRENKKEEIRKKMICKRNGRIYNKNKA